MGHFISALRSTVPCWIHQVTSRWPKWFISYFWILFRKRHSRMFKYDLAADAQPFKSGFFIPSEEWNLECHLEEQEKDIVFCFGINSSGECLAVQIARNCACDSSSSLFLKINRNIYTLPAKCDNLTVNNKRVYGTNRFFIECLVPFRKWKIFFNGVLRKMCLEKEDKDNIIHVRFSFIWVASSGVFDFVSDYSSCNMAGILSFIKWNSFKPPVDRVLSYLNEYHQPGIMHGTVQIENKCPQEVMLWGSRRHSFGTEADGFNSLDVFGNTETGFFFFFKIILDKNCALTRNIRGYIMLSNTSLKSVHFISYQKIVTESKNILSFHIRAGGNSYNIAIFFYEYGEIFGKKMNENVALTVVDVLANGVWGAGIVIKRKSGKKGRSHDNCKQLMDFMKRKLVSGLSSYPLVLNLTEPECMNKSLSGNLGSTLAKLEIVQDLISGYDIPPSLVITTAGYEEFMITIKQTVFLLRDTLLSCSSDDLMSLCEMFVQEVSNSYFPPAIHDALSYQLKIMVKDEDNARFNIHPAISGSDIELQLLEAYLGKFCNIRGFPEVVKCVKNCWASQYSFGAILCKRSSGLPLNVPMAIIIQKVISAETCGIISVCESSTGNPLILEIREVEDMASHQAVRITRLRRDSRHRVKILDSSIMSDAHDNDSGDSDETNGRGIAMKPGKILLSSEQISFLGRLVSKLESCFQFPLVFEWCLNKNTFFIMQARPLTFTNAEPENFRYCDSSIRSEDDWSSAFATGESFYGAMSPLGMNIINFCIEVFLAKTNYITSDLWDSHTPYFPKFLIYSSYHVMYSMGDGILRYLLFSESNFFRTALYIMNFQQSATEAFVEFLDYRHGRKCWTSKMMFQNIVALLTFRNKSKKLEKKIRNSEFSAITLDSARDILGLMSVKYHELTEPFVYFMRCVHRAVLWSMVVFYILGKDKKNKKNVPQDFNILMSACSVSEEGDLAVDMLALSQKIEQEIEPSLFQNMPIEDAKVWLEDTKVDKKVQFSEFLKKHGHRCHKEMDVFQKCWSMDFIPIIHVLQVIVPHPKTNFVPTSYPLDLAFSQLSVTPTFFQKLLLKYAVPKCIETLRDVKEAKCNLLKVAANWRKDFHLLAQKAVEEFHLPFPDSLFFLSLDEINQVLKVGSPHLVMRALKCWEAYTKLDKRRFPAIAIGYPFPFNENYYDNKRLKVGASLRGCPMGRGTVVGTAVVITDILENVSLGKGYILITCSPSIVWSLYFPVLGGFAADLGGIFSDGAVAARECGLPCIINLRCASQIIKTGDRVFLDSNVGVLRRIS